MAHTPWRSPTCGRARARARARTGGGLGTIFLSLSSELGLGHLPDRA